MDEERKPGRKRLIIAVAAGAVVLIVAVFAVLYFVMWRETGPIPRKYTKGLEFTLYYPTRLPKGATVEADSFRREGNVLIYSIQTPYGRSVAVSQQPLPPEAGNRKPTNSVAQIPGERDFTTGIGPAHVSLWGDKYVSDIITPTTWIIINTTGLTVNQATTISQSFTKL